MADKVWWLTAYEKRYALAFDCPGCNMLHAPHVKAIPELPGAPMWQWNGSMESPTFSPSILVRFDWGDPPKKMVCHSFVRDGRIEFLSDCTHALAGQTVDLPGIDVTPDLPHG